MDEKDKIRFARYKPGFKDPLDDELNQNAIDATKLGYISKIAIDKDKFVKDVIENNAATTIKPQPVKKVVKSKK